MGSRGAGSPAPIALEQPHTQTPSARNMAVLQATAAGWDAWLPLLPAVKERAVVLTEWPPTAATAASGAACQPAAEAAAAGAGKATEAPIAPAAAVATAGSPATGAGAGAAAADTGWEGSGNAAAGSRPAREGIGKGCTWAACSLPGGRRRPGRPGRRGWCSRGISPCCSCARRHAAAVQHAWGSTGCCPAGRAAAAAWTRACCPWTHYILATQQRSHLCILIAIPIILLAVRKAAAAPTRCRLCRWWWRRRLPLLPRGLGPRRRRWRRGGSRRHFRPCLLRWDGWLVFAQIHVQLVLPMRKMAPASRGGQASRLWGPGLGGSWPHAQWEAGFRLQAASCSVACIAAVPQLCCY